VRRTHDIAPSNRIPGQRLSKKRGMKMGSILLRA
jgi:hypothetical protein